MSNIKIDALSIVVSKLENEVRDKMFTINSMLSNNTQVEDFTEKLGVKIVELSVAENALAMAKNLLNQSLALSLKDIREQLYNETGKSEDIERQKEIDKPEDLG